MATKLTPKQKLQQARMALMSHPTWCLYSGLLLLGKLEVKELPMGTAATNGRDVYFDPAFVESLTQEELRFVLLHETEHKALRQLSTYEFLFKQNAQLTNIAADFVVNIRLQDADKNEGFIKMPKPTLDPNGKPLPQCIDPKYRGWNTKQVYEDLRQQQKQQGGQGQKSKSGTRVGDGMPAGFDEHDIEGAEALTAEEKEQLKQDIDAAVRQGGLLAGNREGGNSKLLDDVLESQIRWQEILAEFIKSVTKGRDNASWAKVNRRWVSSGLYLPSAVADRVGGLLIGGDASGSTWSGDQLAGFLGEAKAIIEDAQPEFVEFVWWDTAVQKVWRFEPDQYGDMINQIKNIEGGGGTAPSCVTNWIKKEKKEYVAAIMLSDGYVGSDWGDWSGLGEGGSDLPIMWVLNQKGITAPVGQTLYCEGG